MIKHTKSPRPTWRKIGLMAVFLLIVMASSAAQALAEENFGLGADVEVEVERVTSTVIGGDPYLPIYIIISLALIFLVALLLVKFRTRRLTATTGAPHGGEMLG